MHVHDETVLLSCKKKKTQLVFRYEISVLFMDRFGEYDHYVLDKPRHPGMYGL